MNKEQKHIAERQATIEAIPMLYVAFPLQEYFLEYFKHKK